MTKWEYMVVRVYEIKDKDGKVDQAMLNFYGSQGWELICCCENNASLIFKRPVN